MHMVSNKRKPRDDSCSNISQVAESGDLPTAEYLLDGISNDADKIKFLNRKDKEVV